MASNIVLKACFALTGLRFARKVIYPAISRPNIEIAILNTIAELSLAVINPHTIAAITAIPVKNFNSDLATPDTPLVL